MPEFNSWSYVDQVMKYAKDKRQAENMLRAYGWITGKPTKLEETVVTCNLCKENFTPRKGGQKYCTSNSRNENCSRTNKIMKLYKGGKEKRQYLFA